ncbi:MAG: LuxR C-terminal-related transcriptional regulator [Leifsonia sp.]
MKEQTYRVLAEAAYVAGADRGSAVAQDVLALTAAVTHHDASALLVWDPLGGRHVPVMATGYTAETVSGLGDRYATTPEHALLLKLHSPLRIDDLPYDYRRSALFHEVLEPMGFGDGMTVCLFGEDLQYCGMLHLSAGSRGSFDDDAVQMIDALAPVVARISIGALGGVVSHPQAVTRVALIDEKGAVREELLYGRAEVVDDPEFVALVQRFRLSGKDTARGLWPSAQGWLSIELRRMPRSLTSGTTDVRVEETRGPLPFGLSAREIDIIQGMAEGHSNQQIALRRFISARTVSTHVERILRKTEQQSRAGVVSQAAQHGLVALRF